MKSRPMITIGLLLLLVCTTFALGEATLEVRVVDQNGTALQKAKVFIFGVQSRKNKDEKTDKEGVARFKKLDDDYYRVWARHEGFDPVFYDFVSVSGDSIEQFELTLKPGDEKKKLYFEDDALVQRSDQLLTEGAQLFQQNKMSEAEAKFTEVLTINPYQPASYRNLGFLYYQTRQWEKAEASLERAVELYEMYYAFQSTEPMKQQLEQVRTTLDSIPAQRIAGEIDDAMKAQDFDRAALKLRELAALQPDNAKVYYNLTLALARAEQFDEAREAIKTAIRLEPQNQSYKDMVQEIDQAEEATIARAAQVSVDEAAELYNGEQYEAAIVKAEEVRPNVPEEYQPPLWLITARSHAKLERVDQAASAYRMAIALVPDNVDYRQELADYLFKLERYDDAFGVFKEVWELKSEPIDDSFFKLGQDLIKKGKQDMALKAFESALETNPEYAEAYYEMGMEYFYGKGDRPKATEMLKKYVELGKDEARLNNAKSVLVVIEKGL